MRMLCALALPVAFLASSTVSYAGSASAIGTSALQPKAWQIARELAKSQVPDGAKNIKYSWPSCDHSSGLYDCTVTATWDDPEE